MMTQADHDLEKVANLQLHATTDVLEELRKLANVSEAPGRFYWLRGADYVEMDRYGDLECWSRGCRGSADERCGYTLQIDEQLLADGDIDAFKARFRAEVLPEFNELRAQARVNLQATITSSQAKLASMQGDIT